MVTLHTIEDNAPSFVVTQSNKTKSGYTTAHGSLSIYTTNQSRYVLSPSTVELDDGPT